VSITCANTIALVLLTKLIAICSRCEDQVKFFVSQCSCQKVFVSKAKLMLRLSLMYISTLFIIKLELVSRARSVECVKIMFFNFLDNDPIKLIFGE
jgi:hypothetical protein